VGQVRPEELLETARVKQPDVILLKMDESNLVNLDELKFSCPFTLVTVVMENPSHYNVLDLIQNSVRACLPARLFPMQIINIVELVVEGGIVCMPRMGSDFLCTELNEKNGVKLNLLTGREHEVLSMLQKSHSNQEIAQSLCISESTVKTHLRNIYKKLDVRNRTEALVTVMQYTGYNAS
jgi:DNA-binding NarL/FixJ family response regulator